MRGFGSSIRDMAYGRKILNALLIGENQRAWWHIATHLEQRGCNCWFASTNEELRILLSQRPFHLVLSAHPVTNGGPLMDLLQGPERLIYYSFPIEDGCLWFQAVPEISNLSRVSALRPSEFMSILDDFLISKGDSRAQRSQARIDKNVQASVRESDTFPY